MAQHPKPAENSDVLAEKNRRDREALETTANLSVASKTLHERLSEATSQKDFSRYLSDAVLVGDRSIIPYLKARLEGNFGDDQILEIALVNLGETQYVNETIEELKSEDYLVQYRAIWKLARFKTTESYRKLYELLDDNTNRDKNPDDDAVVRTLSQVTKDELFSTVENPPSDQNSTEAWKEWFKSRHLIE
ncbi:MAG: HEAT repeat domain-containing protein [Pyrinomonadaceae bacterium]